MGALSNAALAVAAGMQDQRVRAAVITAMRDSSALGVGLDLQDCGPGSRTRSLFDAAERRGVGQAAALCSWATARSGLVLYMDPDQLAAWSATVIPIVTAVEQPGHPLPAHVLGYRSPVRTIDIAADPNLKGPILVVLPITHPSRMQSRRSLLLPSAVVRIDTGAARQHVRVP